MIKSFNKLMLFAIIASLVFIINACKKSFLELSPQGPISENTLATAAGVRGILIGAYSLLDGVGGPGTSFLTGVANAFVGGVAADEAHKGGSYGAQQELNQIENHSLDASNSVIGEKWQVYYAGVVRANEVLRVLEKVPETEFAAGEKEQIKAEAIFLRAIYHFEAVKLWRNIPYVDETISFGAGNYNVPNTEPVWPRIETDLQHAIDHLTPTKTEIGRANSWAAKAFLAKAYMFQRKFEPAKILLEDLIANGINSSGIKYALFPEFSQTFNALYDNGSESVFAVQMSVNDGAQGHNGNAGEILNTPSIFNGGTFQPSFTLVNSFKTDPITGLPLIHDFNDEDVKHDLGLASTDPFTPYTGTVDPRLDWTIGRRGIPLLDWGLHSRAWILAQNEGGPYSPVKTWLWKKDMGTTGEAYDGWAQATAQNYQMIRFADVLLWAAEVEVEIGTLSKAQDYVNMIRARAANPTGFVKEYIDNNHPETGFTNTPAANYYIKEYPVGYFEIIGKDEAREAVRFERKLELAMEGHRFFDLQRYDNGTGYMADVLNAYAAHEVKVYLDRIGVPYQILDGAEFKKGKNELYPIPLRQIDVSRVNGKNTLEQNNGYN